LPVPIHRPDQDVIEGYISLSKVFPEQLALLLSQ
jgi:hypothetical protein